MNKSQRRNRRNLLFRGLSCKLKHLKYFVLTFVLTLSIYTSNAITCSSGQYDSSTYWTPCQVGNSCNGSTSSSCSSGNYASTYASSCTSYTYGYVVAGILYSWPTNKYKSSIGVWGTCASGKSWNGQTTSSCGSTQVSNDGSCFDCPGDYKLNSYSTNYFCKYLYISCFIKVNHGNILILYFLNINSKIYIGYTACSLPLGMKNWDGENKIKNDEWKWISSGLI